MKRVFSITLIVIILVTSLSISAFAYSFSGGYDLSTTVVFEGGVVTDLTALSSRRLFIFRNPVSGKTFLHMHEVDDGWYYVPSDTGEAGGFFRLDNKAYPVSIFEYKAYQGGYAWVFISNSNTSGISKGMSFVWSNIDTPLIDGSVGYKGDTNFGKPPLAEIVVQMAGGELSEVTMPEIRTTMLTLALCGVGLTALLVAFPLLKRVFSRFLH